MKINVNTKPLIKFEYYIAGTFDKKKNVWLWACNSTTLDKSLISQSIKLHNELDDTHHNEIFKKNYAIVLTDDFKK